MAKLVNKTVKLSLAGLNGNAFVLLGAFQRVAKQARWTDDEIETVLSEATSGDYDKLLRTLDAHCERPDE